MLNNAGIMNAICCLSISILRPVKCKVDHNRVRCNKGGVVSIDVSSIGIKFKEFMHAGCRDQGALT